MLITHFFERYAEENRKEIAGVSSEVQDVLLKYDYSGNVRELENIIERTVVIAREDVISVEDLPFSGSMEETTEIRKAKEGLLGGSIDELEKKLIVEAMEKASDHQIRAAELLGISERMLCYKLKKYGFKSLRVIFLKLASIKSLK
jgi:DNA-binding NtrC family response regulator